MKNQLSKYMKFTEENKKHWVFRCPYCGDSKTENHGHLNVSKNMPVFRCVRCGQGGHIKQLLDHLNANDVILPEYINDGKYTKKKHKTNIISFKEQIEPYVEEYIKKRLNIKNIPNELNILPTTVLHKMIKNTDEYNPVFEESISFLTYRNRKVISRILNNNKFRYYVYSLSDGPDYYVIKNERKYTQYKKHNTVVIGEGVFDISNQYIHRFIDTPNDAVYMCAGNQSFSGAFTLARSLSLTYTPNVIVLADQDIDSSVYEKLARQYKLKSVKVYKNKLGKDFGDHPVEPVLDFSTT